jgi:hypothetical protein
MKGSVTPAPRLPDKSDEAKVEVDTVVWDHPEAEAEQTNKADEISVDDGDVTGIQSII